MSILEDKILKAIIKISTEHDVSMDDAKILLERALENTDYDQLSEEFKLDLIDDMLEPEFGI